MDLTFHPSDNVLYFENNMKIFHKKSLYFLKPDSIKADKEIKNALYGNWNYKITFKSMMHEMLYMYGISPRSKLFIGYIVFEIRFGYCYIHFVYAFTKGHINKLLHALYKHLHEKKIPLIFLHPLKKSTNFWRYKCYQKRWGKYIKIKDL